MIRTYILPCDLPKADADALNHASGLVYTRTLVTHYRVYRKKGNKHRHWLSRFAGQKLNDFLTRDLPPLLHAFSKDAAQHGFYKACKTAKANRHLGARYPHRRKPPSASAIWRRARASVAKSRAAGGSFRRSRTASERGSSVGCAPLGAAECHEKMLSWPDCCSAMPYDHSNKW